MSGGFAPRVLDWFRQCGRHDLPWQRDPSPYRVWVSEIMLQQTQVATVIPYFQRFVDRFPSVEDLAAADVDEVLHLWSGLGYYARARNLHSAARMICEQHQGRFPECFEDVVPLPGIGRSTAGAILALSLDQRHAILDGNVKRVLCRHRGIEQWPGEAATEKRLWDLAVSLTPQDRVTEYTQAMMDLGATVCRRANPACHRCPLAEDCVARASGRQRELPVPRPRRNRPVRKIAMLLVTDPAGHVLLQRRPEAGIWGGLWSFPELGSAHTPEAWAMAQMGARSARFETWPPVRHGFTHFELVITPHRIDLERRSTSIMEDVDWLWYNPQSPARIGLAAVVERLLGAVAGEFASETVSGERDEPDREVRAAGHRG